MAGVAEGPHGGSMGVSGPGTSGMEMGDSGSSAQKGYDYGFGGAASDTSTMEGFRAALARALGQVTQEQKDSAVEAQNNLDANNRAMAAAVEARDKTQREAKAQKEREALESEIDALMDKTNFEVPGTKTTPTEFDPQNPYDYEDVDVVIDDSFFDEDETGLVNPNFNFQDRGYDPNMEVDVGIGTTGLGAPSPAEIDNNTAAIDAFRDKEKGLMGATLDNIARTDKEKEVSKNRTAQLEVDKTLLNKVEEMRKSIKDLPWHSTKKGKIARAIREIEDTTRYRTAYANVHGMSTFGKAILSLAPLGMGWWGPKLSQLAIDNGFIDTSTMADIARDIENSVNKAEPMPDALKKFFVRAEPWAASLTNQQIKYYLDRPEELEWVRNLWSSMNPTQEESMVIID
jgi:hypothetical protein